MKIATAMIAAISLLGMSATAYAAPCKDAKGKFIKCAPAAAPATKATAKPATAPKTDKPAPKRCRDAKGKFAKCGTPGSKPA